MRAAAGLFENETSHTQQSGREVEQVACWADDETKHLNQQY